MHTLKVWSAALGVSFILGCSSGQQAAPPDAAPPAPPAKTVFDPLTRDLDRAHAVQGTVDQNSDAQRKAVDAQERGDVAP